MAQLPSFAAAWMRQRTEGAAAVAAVEASELANLDDATALAMSDALLRAVRFDAIASERRTSSGLSEQQRWFHAAR